MSILSVYQLAFNTSYARAILSRDMKQLPGACLPAQDVGCCFGQELRKAILDGYAEANMVASDLTSEYWCVGGVPLPSAPLPKFMTASQEMWCDSTLGRRALALCVVSLHALSHKCFSAFAYVERVVGHAW